MEAKLLVEPPQHISAPFGLFSVSVPRENERAFLAGVEWQTHDYGRLLSAAAGGTCAVAPMPTGFDGNNMGSAEPVVVTAGFKCSPVGTSPQEATAKAVARLEAGAERAVEAALWEGVTVPGLDGEDWEGLPYDEALAMVETALGETYGQGVIHMSRALALLLLDQGLLKVQGSSLVTKLLTPVVAGVGYRDTGRIVGTSQLFRYEGELWAPDARQVFDKGQNDLYGVASREYVVGFEDEVFVATVEPALPESVFETVEVEAPTARDDQYGVMRDVVLPEIDGTWLVRNVDGEDTAVVAAVLPFGQVAGGSPWEIDVSPVAEIIKVTATAPTLSGANIVIPTVTGVTYKEGDTTVTGNVPITPGASKTITAVAANSQYELEGTTSWTLTRPATEVTPAAPTFADPVVTINSTTGVTYKNGSATVTGTVTLDPGETATITATAASSQYKIKSGATTSWEFTAAVPDPEPDPDPEG